MSMCEKVLKGLECCAVGAECDHCPYSLMNKSGYEGCYQMHADALALLKAQEPRVMHVDEIQEFSTVWLEDVDKPEIIPAIYLETLCGRLGFIQPGRGMIYPKADQCGKRWRPWTSRPTDAQREATPWKKN